MTCGAGARDAQISCCSCPSLSGTLACEGSDLEAPSTERAETAATATIREAGIASQEPPLSSFQHLRACWGHLDVRPHHTLLHIKLLLFRDVEVRAQEPCHGLH